MRGIYSILIALFFLLYFGCANQSTPTGGPKDETPPKLTSTSPEQEQLNFSEKNITLTFDEYIRLDKAKQQILITPRIDQEYEIKQRRNRVILEFDSALNQNTTYTINFRESIVDITEGNPAENLKLAFSTGSYIDSLSISGVVTNLVTGERASKSTVALYPESDTVDLFTGLPTYFTETSDSGTYIIENIKGGNYRLYAYSDTNDNLKAESQKEKYGFLPDTLTLDKNLEHKDVDMINLDLRNIKLISARQSGTTYDIKYNKYLTNYTIIPFDSTHKLASNFKDATHQIISIYNDESIKDSLGIQIDVQDSLQTTLSDTTYVQFRTTKRKPDNLTSTYLTNTIPVRRPQLIFTAQFNKPIKHVNKDSLFINIDSLTHLSLDSAKEEWSNNKTTYTIKYMFDPSLFEEKEKAKPTDKKEEIKRTQKASPTLYIGKGAFISVENDSITRNSLPLQFANSNNLGVLNVIVKTDKSPVIMQLVTSDLHVVIEKPATNKIQFTNIDPGDYILRAIIDRNNNGKWDPGNILKNVLPESIIYFTKQDGATSTRVNTIKANWNVTETFEF